MTREEAIKWLKLLKSSPLIYGEYQEAIDMAIEALSEPKTIIGIDIPYGSDKGIATIFKGKDDNLILEEVKEIMSVVRCKDCMRNNDGNLCDIAYYINEDGDGFCNCGERMKGGDDD